MRDIKQLIVDLESYTLDMGIGDLCSDAIKHITALEARCKELESALEGSVVSMKGYRRNTNDKQPCDAEKNAIKALSTTPTQSLDRFENDVIERCAEVCMTRSNMCALKAEDADSIEDEIELKANAWQFSVLATDIRALKKEVK